MAPNLNEWMNNNNQKSTQNERKVKHFCFIFDRLKKIIIIKKENYSKENLLWAEFQIWQRVAKHEAKMRENIEKKQKKKNNQNQNESLLLINFFFCWSIPYFGIFYVEQETYIIIIIKFIIIKEDNLIPNPEKNFRIFRILNNSHQIE